MRIATAFCLGIIVACMAKHKRKTAEPVAVEVGFAQEEPAPPGGGVHEWPTPKGGGVHP